MTTNNQIIVDRPPAAGDQQGTLLAHGRILSFDLARGFTVLIMPSIHVCMMYSTPEVQQSLLGDILGFIAEGPGAQLFMLLMGVVFALKLSSKMSPSPQGEGLRVRLALKRSMSLFLAAYLLNFFKFVVPLGLGLMPENLLAELQLQPDFHAAKFFLLIGDILQFAAIANLILFIITRSKHYPMIATAMAVAIIFLSPFCWDLHTGIDWLDYILALFGGHPPFVFFPVFPWIVYPLIGLTIGYLLKRYDQKLIMKKLAQTGAGFILISLMLPATAPNTEYLDFYRSRPADTVFHIGIVLIWLSMFHWLSKKIKPNPFFRLLTFCSKHITTIYLVQWVLICWLICFTGYLSQNMIMTWIWMTAITAATLLITFSLKRK